MGTWSREGNIDTKAEGRTVWGGREAARGQRGKQGIKWKERLKI